MCVTPNCFASLAGIPGRCLLDTADLGHVSACMVVLERLSTHMHSMTSRPWARMQRTEKHVEELSNARQRFIWWKGVHVLAVVGAVTFHRFFLTHLRMTSPSDSPALLV